MTPEKALELASQYGIMNVVLIITLFFLGSLVIYVLRQSREREIQSAKDNALRDERWATLYQKLEDRTNERHLGNQVAMAKLEEADRRQREEHETIMKNQKEAMQQHEKISNILDNLLIRMKVN